MLSSSYSILFFHYFLIFIFLTASFLVEYKLEVKMLKKLFSGDGTLQDFRELLEVREIIQPSIRLHYITTSVFTIKYLSKICTFIKINYLAFLKQFLKFHPIFQIFGNGFNCLQNTSYI